MGRKSKLLGRPRLPMWALMFRPETQPEGYTYIPTQQPTPAPTKDGDTPQPTEQPTAQPTAKPTVDTAEPKVDTAEPTTNLKSEYFGLAERTMASPGVLQIGLVSLVLAWCVELV